MLNKFRIGHYTDEQNGTGVTAIIAEKGAVCGASIRGAAPATRETDLLKSDKMINSVHAVVLSGGSAFGLEASCGVMDYLYKNGFGYNAGKYNVPIVVGASLYDLEYKNFAYPDKSNGYFAAEHASVSNFVTGNIGAGTGATISKALGMQHATKGGLGIQLYQLNGIEIAVIVAVNALGDIIKNGQIIAGATDDNGAFLDTNKVFTAGSLSLSTQNTTIGAILTNAKLSKVEANILADIAHNGFALSLSPAHTRYDGDAMFVMASGEKNADINMLTAIIPTLTAQAIQSVATSATPISHNVNKIAFRILQKAFKKR